MRLYHWALNCQVLICLLNMTCARCGCIADVYWAVPGCHVLTASQICLLQFRTFIKIVQMKVGRSRAQQDTRARLAWASTWSWTVFYIREPNSRTERENSAALCSCHSLHSHLFNMLTQQLVLFYNREREQTNIFLLLNFTLYLRLIHSSEDNSTYIL